MEERFNPWLSIWTEPRATIRRIVSQNPNRSLWLLAAIYGFVSLINNAQTLAIGQTLHLLGIFLMVIILAPIWGYLFFSIWSLVVYMVGKLFRGEGTFRAVRAAYAWSCVPFAINLLLWIALTCIFGQKLFMLNSMSENLTEGLTYFMFFVLSARLVLAIWSLVIYFNALAEVQMYSVLRAILNVLLAAILMAVVSWAAWSLAAHFLQPNNQTLKMGFILISGIR